MAGRRPRHRPARSGLPAPGQGGLRLIDDLGERSSFEDLVAEARAGYDAFNRGDIEAVLEHLDAGVTWQRRDAHPVQHVYRGRSQVAREVIEAVREQFAELTLEPIEIVEHGEHIVVRLHQRGRGRSSGVVVEGELVHVLRGSGGRLAELRAFSTVEEALAALAADEGESGL